MTTTRRKYVRAEIGGKRQIGKKATPETRDKLQLEAMEEAVRVGLHRGKNQQHCFKQGGPGWVRDVPRVTT